MTQGHDPAAQVILGTGYTHSVIVESTHDPELKGTVEFRLLSVRETMLAGVKQTQYRGGLAPGMVDTWTQYMAMICATLELAVVKAPSWWYQSEMKNGKQELTPAPGNLRDINVLITIWEAYVAFRDTFPVGGNDSGPGGGAGQS